MVKNTLILGSKGSLGKSLVERFTYYDLPFIELHRKNCNIDINSNELIDFIKDKNISFAINCIAMTGLDNCYINRKKALLINYLFTKKLGEICAKLDINLIHFSTDNIFPCDRKNYTYQEQDLPLPLSWYGITKYLGEQTVYGANGTVIRLPMLYGPTNNTQLISRLIQSLQCGETISVSNDVFTTPVYTPDVAEWICHRILKKNEWNQKIVHLTSDRLISLHEFISEICKGIKCNGKIKSVSSDSFNSLECKPKYGGLQSTIEKSFIFENSINQYLENFR